MGYDRDPGAIKSRSEACMENRFLVLLRKIEISEKIKRSTRCMENGDNRWDRCYISSVKCTPSSLSLGECLLAPSVSDFNTLLGSNLKT